MKKKRHGHLILVVEDDEKMGAMLEKVLCSEGYSIDIAYSGNEAISKITASPYDLVLADMVMPGMDGIELLKEVKSAYPYIYFIIITAFGSDETRERALNGGADIFLSKPVKMEELKAEIKRLLSQSVQKQ
ncbi:MAG: response regulator [Thermodesulfobacteriota bacterium]|nr:response regulator [Thermodesulfobacteriota bacterium]